METFPMDTPPLFCTLCGNSLVAKYDDVGFNPRTGEALTKKSLFCSKKNKWFETHDVWVIFGNLWKNLSYVEFF